VVKNLRLRDYGWLRFRAAAGCGPDKSGLLRWPGRIGATRFVIFRAHIHDQYPSFCHEWKEIKYVNLGLLYALDKSGKDDKTMMELSSINHDLVRLAPDYAKGTVRRLFIGIHCQKFPGRIQSATGGFTYTIPWYLPNWTGSLGLSPPDTWDPKLDLMRLKSLMDKGPFPKVPSRMEWMNHSLLRKKIVHLMNGALLLYRGNGLKKAGEVVQPDYYGTAAAATIFYPIKQLRNEANRKKSLEENFWKNSLMRWKHTTLANSRDLKIIDLQPLFPEDFAIFKKQESHGLSH
jgi:hypothetical protein